MAKEICISSTPHETRLAILEDDQLAEIYYERENEYTLAGSIYNGRVTRVLPGMQSAFVDVGLERDAFLYVTDFMELEDPEETDEIEKAAAAGGNQAPREVRHSPAADGNGSRSEARPQRPGPRPEPKPDQKQESRSDRPAPDRQPKGRRLSVEAIPDAAETVPQSSFVSESADEAHEDSSEPGAKRWRGRRRRRGGRGGSVGSAENQNETAGAEESTENYAETSAEAEVASVIHATTGDSGDRSSSQGRGGAAASPRADRAPEPFVLPGESLSKYGGVPDEEASKSDFPASPAPPARPASTFKPATLIEAPIVWDGSGLLPGESLSKHRSSQPEPADEAEAQAVQAEAISSNSDAPDAFEEEELVLEQTEPSPAIAAEQAVEAPQDAAAEDYLVEEALPEPEPAELELLDDEFEESTESAPEAPAAKPEEFEVKEVIEEPSADEPLADPVKRQDETTAAFAPNVLYAAETEVAEPDASASAPVEPEAETPEASIEEPLTNETDEPEADRTASHNVDPLPPSAFRLFGLGGKKKAEEPVYVEPEQPVESISVPLVSAYAPGSGLIEEELIEEEEFDAPHHHGKTEEHDLEDYEEETLPPQMRTGDLGEMLQEAHLDHRIQLNFDGKTGEDEDDDDGDEDDEDESVAADQPATAGEGQAQPQQPRDRGGRGRRGRGPQGAPGSQGNRRGGPSRRSMQTSDMPIISDLLKPGQEILVQIAKEPIAKKGARITSHIALPGRFLVFMPTVSHIGVSRKIASDEERQRLKRILVHERGEASGGFIVRTAAEGASEEELRSDLRMLIHVWNEIKQRSESSKSPALIYHDLGLIERILRDQVSTNFSSIWVDSEADYERIVRFLNRVSPALVRRVKLYTKETPLFEHFGIQDEIAKALRSKVWLKSGGSIVINQTEALVAIDINTGKYVGKSARLEDTILKTNLDAVPEIVRQIRLRDLGGIIVIDFIDMDERKNRFKVMAALEEALKSDRAPTKVLQFNDFGLVAITRKRVKQSLERTLSVPCPTCQATGMVKSPTTVCNEIYTELRKMKKQFEGADVLLRVNPETVKVLKGNNGSWLTEFEELVSKNILVKSDATLHPEQFDIQG